MQQVITGGIESCLMTLLNHLSQHKNLALTVMSRRAVHNQYYIDFFNTHDIRLIVLENRTFKARIAMAMQRIKDKKMIGFPSLKKHVADLFAQSDIVLDYFNGGFHRELLSSSTPSICFMHTSFPYFKHQILDHCPTFFDSYTQFICLTQTFYNNLVQYQPAIQFKCRHIYNPINVARIRKLSNQPLRIPPHRYFVFLGRFHSDKDHDCVIEAMALFVKQHSDGRLYFLGTGEKETEYRQKIRGYQLEQHITFVGSLNNPYPFLKHAVANILSSPSEGLSTVLIEAAALGVLNISSNTPSCAAEILLEGKAGLLYPVGDHQALARLMGMAWKNEINASSYIQTGLDAIKRFDHHHVATTILSLIQSVCRPIAIEEKNEKNTGQ